MLLSNRETEQEKKIECRLTATFDRRDLEPMLRRGQPVLQALFIPEQWTEAGGTGLASHQPWVYSAIPLLIQDTSLTGLASGEPGTPALLVRSESMCQWEEDSRGVQKATLEIVERVRVLVRKSLAIGLNFEKAKTLIKSVGRVLPVGQSERQLLCCGCIRNWPLVVHLLQRLSHLVTLLADVVLLWQLKAMEASTA